MSLSDAFYRYLPHHCPLCLRPCDHYLCPQCSDQLPQVSNGCRVCALPLEHIDSVCGDCLKHPKMYTQTVCPLLYRHPVDRLLRQFKTDRPTIVAQALLPPLLSSLVQQYHDQPWPDVLVPVPMHWSKTLIRGFNHAHVLCQVLSRHTGIPYQLLLRRPLRLHNQKALPRKHRFTNLKSAFVCETALSGCRVAVIDDIITTCATAMAAAETLRRAGAGRIDIWALARTP